MSTITKNSDDVVIIKPAPNSKKFVSYQGNMGQMTQNFYEKDGNGNDMLVKSQLYESERFDDTYQFKKPRFSHSKKRWPVIDPNDITGKKEILDNNNEAFLELVKKSRLKYTKGPNEGKFIEEYNIFDIDDPFFSHPEFGIDLSQGEGIIQVGQGYPLNKAAILGLKANKEFQVGSMQKGSFRRSDVRYIIVDKSIDRLEKRRIRDLDTKSRKYLDALTEKKRAIVAVALNIINSPDVDPGTIEDLIWDFGTDSIGRVGGARSKTKQETFVELLDSGMDNVMTHYNFQLGKSKGIIRLINGEFSLFGQALGKTKTDCVKYLLLDKNDQLRQRLQDAIETKEV